MKHNISILILIAFSVAACRSQPNKAEAVSTKLDQASAVSGHQSVGVKGGEMVVLDKVQMSEKLRDLQNGVYALEDKVYGTRKLGTLGLYGDLKSCFRKLASHQYGGTGTLIWAEPLDRISDKEDELKVELNEKKDLVGVNEEYLRDRLQRFQGYKAILQKRSDDFEERLTACKSEVASRELDTNQSSKVMVQELPKVATDRVSLNTFMCSYARNGASLQQLMLTAFSKGWLSLADVRFEQNLLPVALKDTKGKTKDNALLFNGWKLAYDKSPITIGDLLAGKDAQLVAWAYDKKADAENLPECLSGSEGAWNP